MKHIIGIMIALTTMSLVIIFNRTPKKLSENDKIKQKFSNDINKHMKEISTNFAKIYGREMSDEECIGYNVDLFELIHDEINEVKYQAEK